MTLEEKAYEYAKYNDNGRVSVNDDKFKAYIAGATENGIVWHDLRKNPQDLPKNNIDCIAVKEYEGVTGKYTRCKLSTYKDNMFIIWNHRYASYVQLNNVIAWCEIPKFEDVEELLEGK